MTSTGPSPFARPWPGLRIKEGGPPIQMPSMEEAESYPAEAQALLDGIRAAQADATEKTAYGLEWVEGGHFLIAGGTGQGLGGCLSTAVMDRIGKSGSLTIVSRDPSRSVAYETGILMRSLAERAGMGKRFHWLNYGLALEGKKFNSIAAALKDAAAEHVIYINAVAAAHSGLLPGYPPVFVKDVDEDGLFQWRLQPLTDHAVEVTKSTMGTLAVQFPSQLEKAGVSVGMTVFCDWRGSLDRISRDPSAPEYGRQGPYSTSLYLPKDIIHEATASAYASGGRVIDVFLPVMRTRALSLIPGGVLLYSLFGRLMEMEGLRRPETPELALAMLDRIGAWLRGDDRNPFPRLDSHEAALDLWFIEVLTRLDDDEASDFYFRKWAG